MDSAASDAAITTDTNVKAFLLFASDERKRSIRYRYPECLEFIQCNDNHDRRLE
jgi:hypothetical protein